VQHEVVAHRRCVTPPEKTSILRDPQTVGTIASSTSLGAVFGSVFAGLLVDHVGFRSVYAVHFASCVIGLLGCTQLPPTERNTHISMVQAVQRQVTGVYPLLLRPMLQITTLNTFILFINQGITDVFLPVYLKEVSYTATLVGTAATVRTAGSVLIKSTLDPIARRLGRVNVLFAGVIMTAMLMGPSP